MLVREENTSSPSMVSMENSYYWKKRKKKSKMDQRVKMKGNKKLERAKENGDWV